MDYFLTERIRILCDILKQKILTTRAAVQKIDYAVCDYKTNNTPPALSAFRPYDKTVDLAVPNRHHWLHFMVDTPAVRFPENELLLEYTANVTGGHWWADAYPQSIVYINGKMVQGMDRNHTSCRIPACAHLDVYMYNYFSYGESPAEAFQFSVRAAERDTVIKNAYYDLSVPLETIETVLNDDRDIHRAQIMRVLEQAYNRIDLNGDTAAIRKAAADISAFLKEEFYDTQCGGNGATVHCIGHTHIDVAWLWTLAQTKEKAQRSFCTVLRLMEQYPEYQFMSSQPQLYQYVKEEAPEIYAQIKQRIAEGRWEPEGAMWLEADCNLTGGESLVRQIVHGKRFMQQEFGVNSRILWLPDVFGYSAALPQILKQSGVDAFVTSKISWNETNTLPYDTFVWQGIDGSEIFTNFLTAQGYAHGKDVNGTTYNSLATPADIMGSWDRYHQKEYNTHTCISYGFGDGGGGPTEKMLETLRRTAYGLPGMPKTKISSAKEWLAAVHKEFFTGAEALRRMPRWVGELYLEYHRGTYTSIAKNKKNNRRAEFMLARMEWLCTLCSRLFGAVYPSDTLYQMWQTVLLLQFHDIIPGSSIEEVYNDSDRQYAELFAEGEKIQTECLRLLQQNIGTAGGQLVINPLGRARTGLIRTENGLCETPPIPAYGWAVLPAAQPQCRVHVNKHTAENDFYRLTLDTTGGLASIWDKQACRELLQEGEVGNRLRVYEDYPRAYDNWEICNYHSFKYSDLKALSVIPTADGCRAGFKITYIYEGSVIVQSVYLYSTGKRIDFETEADWQVHHRILKAEFPFAVHTNHAKYEIQYGHVERPTHRNTSWDAARFEVCGHKWADLSENGYGVSLLNDCKYGFSAEGSTLRLTLLKSGTYPNRNADIGKHTFVYALLPHSGNDWMDTTITEAYSLNQPLLTLPAAPCTGDLPQTAEMLSADADNAVIETVKQAYDGSGIIVRLYEAENRRGIVRLRCGFAFKEAVLCDLLEQEQSALAVENGEILLPLGNFKIATIKIK